MSSRPTEMERLLRYFKEFRVSSIKSFPEAWDEQYRYKSHNRILILGEMDFSFSLALLNKIPDCQLLSTAYYSSRKSIPEQCRKDAKKNIERLEAKGCKIKFNIDATNVHLKQLYDARSMPFLFDKIIFTFPRAGDSKKGNYQQATFIRNIMNKLCVFYLNQIRSYYE